MKILISLDQIKEYDPCEEGWDILLEAKGKYEADDELFPVSDILEINGLDDTLWSLRCLPEYDNLWRKFAWWCANEVVSNASDPRVKKCLDVVWKHSEGQATDEELKLAKIAAISACSLDSVKEALAASYAAVCSTACSTARHAVHYAIYSTVSCVANYAAGSVYYAEGSAAYATTRKAQTIKLKEILNTGVFVK